MSGSNPAERTVRLLALPPGRVFTALALAPTPVFATLALLSAGQQDSLQQLVCAGGHMGGLTGMVPMYLLMSLFHAAPWLRLCTAGRGRV